MSRRRFPAQKDTIMNHPTVIKSLLVSLAILIGIVTGLVAGILARVAGASVAAAARDGGIAFGGTVTLVIVIMTALGLLWLCEFLGSFRADGPYAHRMEPPSPGPAWAASRPACCFFSAI